MKVRKPNVCRGQQALCIVDVQSKTFKGDASQKVHEYILKYLENTTYDCYVIVAMDATENSMLFKQKMAGESELEDIGPADVAITNILQQKQRPYVSLTKETRSGFKSFNTGVLKQLLNENQIKEVHVVGFDVNDCVLSTAYDALDLGYFSYVIEELVHHAESDEDMKAAALKILREQKMTNHSMSKKLDQTVELIELS